MKRAIVWIIIGIAVAAIVVGVVRHNRTKDVKQLPPPDTTALAGPQAPIPNNSYNPTEPLSKNQTTYKDNMKIEVIKDGTGEGIKDGQVAVVSYVGKLQNGTVFDASANHGDGSFSFTVGAGQVIKGWDEGVQGMKVGESRTLTIPPELAYGPNGVPPVIPPSATLIFDVSLLAIK